MDSSTSEGSVPLTPVSSSARPRGMIDQRWKRPLVVVFQEQQPAPGQAGFDTQGAASFIEEIKDSVKALTIAIQALELRVQKVEDIHCACKTQEEYGG
ncbi:uncharacterized protein FPRO_07149 [Fusarium proliferatum ET1]|uniref:Uncharacterized protein n=1 Tax=Fusarium proliferatum (strain ET1) TaxID=1227346 RepID=A0A1L7VE04_FUSPR|nr:uncharacterized protein FPRO_07149 [Fusarium proliferatum ET1]CVL13588.1 uncharacterized protein FPRN_06977 [Fusarium proliferatum]CZR37660.1 uncharacterized protein FPRO_07149 [Fusarium proliferatum ET1]